MENMAGLIKEVVWIDDVDAQDGIPKGPVLLRLNLGGLNVEELAEVINKFAPGKTRTLVTEMDVKIFIKISSAEQKFSELNVMGVVSSVELPTIELSAA